MSKSLHIFSAFLAAFLINVLKVQDTIYFRYISTLLFLWLYSSNDCSFGLWICPQSLEYPLGIKPPPLKKSKDRTQFNRVTSWGKELALLSELICSKYASYLQIFDIEISVDVIHPSQKHIATSQFFTDLRMIFMVSSTTKKPQILEQRGW